MMAPIRSAASPQKVERTKEENQERAYIAASRRSDRSLEARLESARRASEVHEARTGKRLKVTEEAVANEEVYEEEDADMSRHFSRMAGFETHDPQFGRRVQEYLMNQLAVQGALQHAVNQSNRNLYQQHAQYMRNVGQMTGVNPAMMQATHPGAPTEQNTQYSVNAMMPPNQPQRMSSNHRQGLHRQAPYQIHHARRTMRPDFHNRSASIANPQGFADYQQPHSQPTSISPIDTVMSNERRMSLPPQNTLLPTPTSQTGATFIASPTRVSPTTSVASTDLPTPQATVPNDLGPLTTTLALNDQQLLYGSSAFTQPLTGPMKPATRPTYSYNPNGNKSRSNSADSAPRQPQPPTSYGLDQTLYMPSSQPSDTGVPSIDADTQPGLFSSVDYFTSGFDPSQTFDDLFSNMDGFNGLNSSQASGSGQITPGDPSAGLQFLNDSFFDAPQESHNVSTEGQSAEVS